MTSIMRNTMNYSWLKIVKAFFVSLVLWNKVKKVDATGKECWVLYLSRGRFYCVLADNFSERRLVNSLYLFRKPQFGDLFWQVAQQVV